jgi:hypothetical protein
LQTCINVHCLPSLTCPNTSKPHTAPNAWRQKTLKILGPSHSAAPNGVQHILPPPAVTCDGGPLRLSDVLSSFFVFQLFVLAGAVRHHYTAVCTEIHFRSCKMLLTSKIMQHHLLHTPLSCLVHLFSSVCWRCHRLPCVTVAQSAQSPLPLLLRDASMCWAPGTHLCLWKQNNCWPAVATDRPMGVRTDGTRRRRVA